ncbi:RsbRD N-terminal domain-containing protein [Desulfovibrio aminophilus]|uniref:RsbRD N-terminal domain-containing protein n=1 Tax=Desulfovibrio aminophilus TaxID=81425 RepID=UPI0033945BAF
MARTEDQRRLPLLEQLASQEEPLVTRWVELIFGTYPAETQKVWKANRDLFENPVGQAIRVTAAEVFSLLLSWEDADALCAALDRLVKIRAVQDFAPSEALSFVFLLKKALREALADELSAQGRLAELLAFETRVDNMALLAFDVYFRDRKQIYELRVKEIKLAHRNIMRKAGLVLDVAAEEAVKA